MFLYKACLWNDLSKAYRTTAHIGLWMIGGVFFLVVVVELIKTKMLADGTPPPESGMAIIRFFFFGAAAGVFLMRAVNRRVLASRSLVSQRGPVVRYAPDILRLMSASISTFAFCESVAILGLFLVVGSDTVFISLCCLRCSFFRCLSRSMENGRPG